MIPSSCAALRFGSAVLRGRRGEKSMLADEGGASRAIRSQRYDTMRYIRKKTNIGVRRSFFIGLGHMLGRISKAPANWVQTIPCDEPLPL